jgi:endonuclease/exonuclease/phosphatase family metal-dependent hydrolase
MRLVSQNLLGHHEDWPTRRPVLRDGLRALAPDVATFQEAIVTADHDQVADLLGPDYHVAHHGQRESDGSGISVASRWPLGAVRELDLQAGPRTRDFRAAALVVDVPWPDLAAPLLVVNHKPSWATDLEHERERQAVTTARYVEGVVAATGQHAVVAGDLDAMPDAASIRFWRGLQSLDGTSVSYRDTWELTHGTAPGPTFAPSLCPLHTPQWRTDLDRRIDYVFVRCDRAGPTLRVTRCERTLDQPVDGAWGSDHFGLAVDLEPAGNAGWR